MARYLKKRKTARVSKKRLYKAVKKVTYSLAETKYFEQSFSFPTGSYWTQFSFLNALAVGNTNQTRIGNKIYLRYLRGRIRWTGVVAAMANTSTVVRMIIFKAIGINNGTANKDQILVTDPTIGSGTYATSRRNNDYLVKFRVLYDRTVSMVPISLVAGSQACGPYGVSDFYIPVNELVTFDDTAGTNTSSTAMHKNDWYMAWAPLDNTCCVGSAQVSACFKDM